MIEMDKLYVNSCENVHDADEDDSSCGDVDGAMSENAVDDSGGSLSIDSEPGPGWSVQ